MAGVLPCRGARYRSIGESSSQEKGIIWEILNLGQTFLLHAFGLPGKGARYLSNANFKLNFKT